MQTLHHTAAAVHSTYLAVADRYIDDAPAEAEPTGPTLADDAWLAEDNARRAKGRHFDERAALAYVMGRYESGLTDLDCCPGGIG